MNKFQVTSWLVLLLINVVPCLHAEETPFIISEQALSFGRIAVVNSAKISNVSIDANGTMSASNSVHILELGHPAKFIMVNYAPYTQLNITTFIPNAETTTGVILSNQFTLKAIQAPLTVITDSDGRASFSVGATLETSGDTSKIYYDTLYKVKFIITVNY